jgi:hypothetical protein
MAARPHRLVVLLALVLCGGCPPPAAAQPATVAATPAPAEVTAELRRGVELARARFEARDLTGVLATISEQYRSAGMTKSALREELAAMFALYRELQARVALDRVELVAGGIRIYTSGEVSGRLPVVGWVTVLTWQGEPEVVRREATGWRLYGFQD